MPKPTEDENGAALTSDMSLEALFGVKGQVFLVTGGGSGIGAMIAVGLARNGATVYIASRKDISAFAAQVDAQHGGKVVALQADVGNTEDVKRLVATVREREGKLNALINNAGTNFSAPIGKYSPEAFEKVMRVNVNSVFTLTQEAAPLLEESARACGRPSRVLNISSINGVRPSDFDTFAYSASKAGVIRLSQHLASKLGRRGILVNSICPGPFESRMMRGTVKMVGKKAVGDGTVVGRMGSPQDIAATVLFLCGNGGSFVTGTEIIVDGGSLVKSRL
eukprot:Rhum_TRINITY_DN12063_c0_g1::Rhum_TRINITY_DN12063_c0_g1_i1::g.48933::m.48933